MLTMFLSLMITFSFMTDNANPDAREKFIEDTPTSQTDSFTEFVDYHQFFQSAYLINSALMPLYTCHSGGDGASSCNLGFSLLGCSVSCVEGYQACCSFWYGCKCIKIDSPNTDPEIEEGTFWA
jgi:hypothetical protein